MKYDIYTDRRKNERRNIDPNEDILCRRIFGDRRKQDSSLLSRPHWLDVDLDEVEDRVLEYDNLDE
jgi:hypothetical protein